MIARRWAIVMMIAMVTLPQPASAESAILRFFTKWFAFGKDVNDTTGELKEGLNLMGRVSPELDEDVEDVSKRSQTFQVAVPTIKPPKFSADELFSGDPDKKKSIQAAWDDYLSDEKERLEALERRRDAQQESLDQYRAKLHFAGEYKKFLEALAENPVTPKQYEMAKKAVTLEPLETQYGTIILNFERIMKDYDRKIDLLKTNLQRDRDIKALIDGVRTPDRSSPPSANNGSATSGSASSPSDRSYVDKKIDEAVRLGDSAANAAENEKHELQQQKASTDRRNDAIAGSQRQSSDGATGTSVDASGGQGSGTSGSGADAGGTGPVTTLQTTVPSPGAK